MGTNGVWSLVSDDLLKRGEAYWVFANGVSDYPAPFSATNFADFPVNTLISSIAQAGSRYEGDVDLNPSALDTPGLLQIYQTVLNRAENLSINGTPPVDYAPAHPRLRSRRQDIGSFMLPGNEAVFGVSRMTLPPILILP